MAVTMIVTTNVTTSRGLNMAVRIKTSGMEAPAPPIISANTAPNPIPGRAEGQANGQHCFDPHVERDTKNGGQRHGHDDGIQ